MSPACDAVTEQVPVATSVSVVPLTVHTEGVLEANCTVRPELALADSAAGEVPKVWPPGDAKLMVCATGAGATVKVRDWVGAAAYVLSPACAANTLQVPADTSVNVPPEVTVHTEAVLEPNCTDRPDVAVAESAGGATPIVWVAGGEKLWVWAVNTTAGGATVAVRVRGVAAA